MRARRSRRPQWRQLANVAALGGQLVVDNDPAAIRFVAPHTCKGCGKNTDTVPCHRCGYHPTADHQKA